jgi:hypothetical protein
MRNAAFDQARQQATNHALAKPEQSNDKETQMQTHGRLNDRRVTGVAHGVIRSPGTGHGGSGDVPRRAPGPSVRLRRVVRALADESGSATAEYAVATMAAVGFAGLLVLILRGDEVRGILTGLVRKALTVAD